MWGLVENYPILVHDLLEVEHTLAGSHKSCRVSLFISPPPVGDEKYLKRVNVLTLHLFGTEVVIGIQVDRVTEKLNLSYVGLSLTAIL